MLDLHKLEIFLTVAEAGSFSAAAERLSLTQPGVSQHMHTLESGLGTALFQRRHSGVTLTEAGQVLLPYARQMIALSSEAENAVAVVEAMRAGSVSIGATPGVGVYLLPVWLQAFRLRYPNLRAAVTTLTTPQVIAALRDGLADIGIIEGEVEDSTGLELRTLEDVEQFAIVGADHAWWHLTQVPLQALNGMAIIQRQAASQSRRWLESVLARFGIVPVITAEFDNVESIKRTVSAGSCLAILPAYTITQEENAGLLRRVAISGSPLRRALKIAWPYHQRNLSPVSRAFIREVARFFPAAALD